MRYTYFPNMSSNKKLMLLAIMLVTFLVLQRKGIATIEKQDSQVVKSRTMSCHFQSDQANQVTKPEMDE